MTTVKEHQVQTTTLASGLQIASAKMAAAESVAIGIWIKTGARDENDDQHGIAHMLEHMAFKGTVNRDAAAIAREVEDRGGSINAHTSREETAYYLRLMPEDLAFGVELLADILFNSTFPEDEIAREKNVIIQEINQAFDTPDDVVFDLFQGLACPNHSLGRPILGTAERVAGFSRNDLQNFMGRHYVAENIVISAAGNVNHDDLLRHIETHITAPKTKLITEPNNRIKPLWPSVQDPRMNFMTRELEQTHVVMGLDGLAIGDGDRMVLAVLSTLLGGGMSSRLFQEAREKRGLCYSVFSFSQSFSDSGILAIYAGTSQDDVAEMTRLAGQQLIDIAASGTADEVKRAVSQIRAALRMQKESVSANGDKIARHLMLFGRIKTTQEMLDELADISADDVRALTQRLLKKPPVAAAIGSDAAKWLDQQQMTDAFAV